MGIGMAASALERAKTGLRSRTMGSSCALLLGRAERRPMDDGGVAPRSVMHLCLSFDHRAPDGAQAGRFMLAVRSRLEADRGATIVRRYDAAQSSTTRRPCYNPRAK